MFTDPLGLKHMGTPAWKTHVTTGKMSLLERGGAADPEKAATYDEGSQERSASESGAKARA